MFAIFLAAGLTRLSSAQEAPRANPYAFPDSFGISKEALAQEDQASPFANAHFVKQQLYLGLYASHYDDRLTRIAYSPGMPGVSDAQGHPLWFDEGIGGDMLIAIPGGLFATEQFDNLDRLFADWSDARELTADGQRKLAAFRDAIGRQFTVGMDWDIGYQRIRRWREKSPRSIAAGLAEVMYWNTLAWNARGTHFGDAITADGWKLSIERLNKADRVLKEIGPFAANNPLWHYENISLAAVLDKGVPEKMEAFAKAYAADPTFIANYSETARFLGPNWGGDWDTVDRFIKSAASSAAPSEGRSMYARLYMAVDECGCVGFSLFRDTLATWPLMKDSFEELLRLYPRSGWNANRYAAYACMAGDKQTYLAVRFKIGKAVIPGAWLHPYSLDLCEHRYPAQAL